MDTTLIIKVLVCVFALYGLILLVRKLWNRNENNKSGELKYYVSEQYRYMNFKDFKTKFIALFKQAISAKTFAEKKNKFNEVKVLTNSYLAESPKAKYLVDLVKNLIIGQLLPLVIDQIDRLIYTKNAQGQLELNQTALKLCLLGKKGKLFAELINKVVDPAFNQLLNASKELSIGFSVAESIGINIKSLFKGAIKAVLDKELGQFLETGQTYIDNLVGPKISKRINKPFSCKYDPDYIEALPIPPVPENVVLGDIDLGDIEGFRYYKSCPFGQLIC